MFAKRQRVEQEQAVGERVEAEQRRQDIEEADAGHDADREADVLRTAQQLPYRGLAERAGGPARRTRRPPAATPAPSTRRTISSYTSSNDAPRSYASSKEW